MMKKKLLTGILVMGLLTPISVDAAYKSYVGYKLPAVKGNNYTSYHEKTTNNDYIRNVVERISGTSSVNFWANDGKTISKKYNQKRGNSTKINFYKDKDKGNDVRMAMENNKWSFDRAFVAGRVDFR